MLGGCIFNQCHAMCNVRIGSLQWTSLSILECLQHMGTIRLCRFDNKVPWGVAFKCSLHLPRDRWTSLKCPITLRALLCLQMCQSRFLQKQSTFREKLCHLEQFWDSHLICRVQLLCFYLTELHQNWELKSAIWGDVRISETSQVIIRFDNVGLAEIENFTGITICTKFHLIWRQPSWPWMMRQFMVKISFLFEQRSDWGQAISVIGNPLSSFQCWFPQKYFGGSRKIIHIGLPALVVSLTASCW